MSSPNRFGSNATKAQSVAVVNQSGENGLRFISNTVAQTPTSGKEWWTSVYVVTDAVFTKLTNTANEGASMDAISVKAGQTISGQITAITLASGSVVAFY